MCTYSSRPSLKMNHEVFVLISFEKYVLCVGQVELVYIQYKYASEYFLSTFLHKNAEEPHLAFTKASLKLTFAYFNLKSVKMLVPTPQRHPY